MEADRNGEAGRLEDPQPSGLSEARRKRDAELAKDGWKRRFVGAPPRLDECRDLYQGMGLDVLLDPVSAEELRNECEGCTLALTLFRVLYTRRTP